MNLIKTLVVGALATGLASCGGTATTGTADVTSEISSSKTKEKKPVVVNKESGLYAIFHTTKGDIKVGLQFELTPLTVGNFVALAKGEMPNDDRADGEPFYDGLKFHRVIDNFMIQGGCPQGTGQGNPGYSFADEFVKELKHDGPGVLSMANSGPATNGSQFFITHKATPWLDMKHTVFGFVISGQEVVDSIAQGDMINSIEIVAETKAAKRFKAKETFDNVQKEAIKKAAEVKERAEKEYKEFIAKNHPNAKRTASGLYYDVTTKGDGARAKTGDMVSVNYTGKLLDGTVFDTSVETVAKANNKHNPNREYQPIMFTLGERRVIAGWEEGVALLNVGDKATLIIPSKLAYGERGAGGVIPPNAPLVFDVELVSAGVAEEFKYQKKNKK